MQPIIENMLFSDASAALALITCGFLGWIVAKCASRLCATLAQRKVPSSAKNLDWVDECTDAPSPTKSSMLSNSVARKRSRRQEKSVKLGLPDQAASSYEDQSNGLTQPVLSSADECLEADAAVSHSQNDKDCLVQTIDETEVLPQTSEVISETDFTEAAEPATPCGQDCTEEEGSPTHDNKKNRAATIAQKKAERKARARKAQKDQLQKEQEPEQQEPVAPKTEAPEPILPCADNLPTTEEKEVDSPLKTETSPILPSAGILLTSGCIKPAELMELTSDEEEANNEEIKTIEYGYETDDTYGDGGDWDALEEFSNPSGDSDAGGSPTQFQDSVVYVESQMGFCDGQNFYEPIQTPDGQQLYTDGVTLFAAVCMPVDPFPQPQPPSPLELSPAMASSISLLRAASSDSGACTSSAVSPIANTNPCYNSKPQRRGVADKDDWDICWDFLPKKRWA